MLDIADRHIALFNVFLPTFVVPVDIDENIMERAKRFANLLYRVLLVFQYGNTPFLLIVIYEYLFDYVFCIAVVSHMRI